jgi:excisionase family DNA binding protein
VAEIKEVMDIRAASDYLGISTSTLYNYVTEGKIPAFKMGNRWKFKKTVLDRWMESQSAASEHRGPRRLRATSRKGLSHRANKQGEQFLRGGGVPQ